MRHLLHQKWPRTHIIVNRTSILFSTNASRNRTLLSSRATDILNSLQLIIRIWYHTPNDSPTKTCDRSNLRLEYEFMDQSGLGLRIAATGRMIEADHIPR